MLLDTVKSTVLPAHKSIWAHHSGRCDLTHSMIPHVYQNKVDKGLGAKDRAEKRKKQVAAQSRRDSFRV